MTRFNVLKAFVSAYGMSFTVGGRVTQFLDYKHVTVGNTVLFDFPNRAGTFWSVSKVKTVDPNIVDIGVAYCIDLILYREMLRRRKVVPSTTNGPDPFMALAGQNFASRLVVKTA